MYTLINLLTDRTIAKPTRSVSERSTAYELPQADAYAKRLAGEAEDWLAFARERSRMRDDTLVRKALHSLAFSLRHGAHDLAVPTKLVGTAKHQRVLWQLVRDHTPLGTRLDTHEDGKRLVVSINGETLGINGETLGEVQAKHTSWLRPLVPFGAGLYLVRVTGHESEGYRLGVNVAVARAGRAVAALRHALGSEVGGDGHGAQGDAEIALLVRPATATEHVFPVHPETDALGGDPADVLLWRDRDGTAHASVAHRARHSPTGIEWGYRGSGPADLARSVLLALTDETTAEALYQRLKDEVVAAVPEAGGVLRAVDLRRWIDARIAPGYGVGGDGAA